MFKTKCEIETKRDTILMPDMPPCSIGRIVDERYNTINGCVVMRTANIREIEIMNLSEPGPDSCWIGNCMTLEVELLPPGSVVILTVI